MIRINCINCEYCFCCYTYLMWLTPVKVTMICRSVIDLCISPHKMSTIVSLILTLLLFKAANSNYTCHAPVYKSDTYCYADTPIKGTDVNFAVGYSIGGVTRSDTTLCCKFIGCYSIYEVLNQRTYCDGWGDVYLLNLKCFTVGSSLQPIGLVQWADVMATPGISCYVNGTSPVDFQWTV